MRAFIDRCTATAATSIAAARRASVMVMAIALVSVGAPPCAHAKVGDVDPTYGVGGRFQPGLYGGTAVLAILNDGRVIYAVDGGYGRTDVNGLPDASFGSGGRQGWPAGYGPASLSEYPFSRHWQRTGQGKWLAALSRVDAQGETEFAILRLRQDGTPDPTFGSDGVAIVDVTPDGVRDPYLVAQPDGKPVLLLARRSPDNGWSYDRLVLVRQMQDGTPDGGFGTSGWVSVPTEPFDWMDGTGIELISNAALMVQSGPTASFYDMSGAAWGWPECPNDLCPRVADLLSDGGWVGWAYYPWYPLSGYVLSKWFADGSPDLSFVYPAPYFPDDSTGEVILPGDASHSSALQGASASVDGHYVYAWMGHVGPPDSKFTLYRYFSGGSQSGPDDGFGTGGAVAFRFRGAEGRALGLADGSTMITTGSYAYRLLGHDAPSPGLLGVADPPVFSSSSGVATLRVQRAAGSDGELRVRYRTAGVGELPAGPGWATPGSDFDLVSGELDWGDGDTADRSIDIHLRRDGSATGIKSILVRFEVVDAESWVAGDEIAFGVDYGPPTPPPPSGGGSGGGGGGGGVGYAMVLLLAVASLARGRICARAIALGAVTVVTYSVSMHAVAAPGDVDPTFAYPRPAVLEPDSTNAIRIADGYLVIKSHMPDIAEVNPVSTLEVEKIDGDGHLDTSFGLNGKVVNTLPGRVNLSTAAAALADGTFLVGGFLAYDREQVSTPMIVRLDSTGHVDPTSWHDSGLLLIPTYTEFGSRVAGIRVLGNGDMFVLTWSAYVMDLVYGDCPNNDVVELTKVPAGFDPSVDDMLLWGSLPRTRSATNACHTSATLLQVGDVIFEGSEFGVFGYDGRDVSSAATTVGWGFGPVALDTPEGDLMLTEVDGNAIGYGKPAGTPQQPDPNVWRYVCIACAAGFDAPIAWNPAVYDESPQRLYLGFATDAGQVGVAALRLSGELDTGWSNDGVVPLISTPLRTTQGAGLADDIRLLDVRPDGKLVVVTGAGLIVRLEGGVGAAHGAFVYAPEEDVTPGRVRTVTVPVYRTGGSQGAVSVDFATATCAEVMHSDCPDGAQPGTEFMATSGRLDWADGDATPKQISVSIPSNARNPSTKRFFVVLSNAQGGASILSSPSQLWMLYPSSQGGGGLIGGGGGSGGGGGGSFGGLGVLLALLAAFVSRRRVAARAYC